MAAFLAWWRGTLPVLPLGASGLPARKAALAELRSSISARTAAPAYLETNVTDEDYIEYYSM